MKRNILWASDRIAISFSFSKLSVNLFFIGSKLRVEVFQDMAIVSLVAMSIWWTNIHSVRKRLEIGVGRV